MKRRTLLGAAVSALGLGAGACQAAAPGAAATRAGVLGGPEEDVLRFVASANPELKLELRRHASAGELRAALISGELDFGSFETAQELSAAPESALLASAGATVTLPLGFYSKKRRVLSELERGSRVAVPREQIAQGRALWVLYQYGLVGFDDLLGPAARLSDVQHNPRRLELVTAPQRDLHERLETDELVALSFADAARLGLAPARDALAMEDGFSPCAQILSVRRGNEGAPWLGRLLAAYRASAVKDFILRRFQDSVRRAW